MSLSHRLDPTMLKHLRIQVVSDASHEQSCKYPDECFLNPRISKRFTVNLDFLISKVNYFHRFHRSNENFELPNMRGRQGESLIPVATHKVPCSTQIEGIGTTRFLGKKLITDN